MGFLDHTTNSIVVDAVLTDKGRQLLSETSTGLQILSYAFADPEVDYSNLEKYGDIIGSEKIIKNTPIYEATTSSKIALFYHDDLLYSSEDGTNSLTIQQGSSLVDSVSDTNTDLEMVVNYVISGSSNATLRWRVYYDSRVLRNIQVGGNTGTSVTWSGHIKYVEVQPGTSAGEGSVTVRALFETTAVSGTSTTITIQEDAISGLSIQQSLSLN